MFKILFLILLTSCSNVFSPNYSEYICLPPSVVSSLTLETKESNTCCENSGIATCCFGGIHVCVDGSSGTGCCPTN